MAVETAPAPAPQSTEPLDQEQVHSGLFWLTIVAIVVGGLLLASSRVWANSASNWIQYPTTDRTTVAEGQLTLYVDPETALALPAPRTQSLRVTQRVSTVGESNKTAFVTQNTIVDVGSRQHAFLGQQYVIDRKSVKNLKSLSSWAFVASNITDRSSAYSVNLPFDTGGGPYAMWMDEVGSAYAVAQQGQPFTEDGVAVVRLTGRVDGAPAVPEYIAQLKSVGVPDALTLGQLTVPLKEAGVDFDTLMRALQPKLSETERTVVDGPISLDYSISADMRILVEPRSGTIVSVENADRTLSARLDSAGLAAFETVLMTHDDVGGAKQAVAVLAELGSAPITRVATEHYAQTPSSVMRSAEYAAAQRDDINKVTNVIPNALFAVGLAAMVVGLVAGLLAWRRRNWRVVEWSD